MFSIRPRLLADFSLLGVALIWGLTFVMVQDAVRAYPVFSFLATRFAFAALGLAPLLWWQRRRLRPSPREAARSQQILAGSLLGLFLFAGYAFQTAGLLFTTPAKAGFITGLSVVLVPVLSVAFLHERPRPASMAGVALAVTGLALLSLTGYDPATGVNPGDLLVLGCAFSFAAHVFLAGRFAPRMNALVLTLVQVTTVASLAGLASLLFETPAVWPPQGQPLFAALFTGVLATALAFGIQMTAQRFTTAMHTALIFATEPVFAALGSAILIGEILGFKELLGCGLILAGMLAAEVGPALVRRSRPTTI